MGVRGLIAALKAKKSRPVESIPPGSTLIVDGDGWIFQLLQVCEKTCIPFLGGNYDVIDRVIREEYEYLSSTLGLHLQFYFGGESDSFKDATIEKRLMQREMKWLQMYGNCRDRKVSDASSLPIPPLSIHQMHATLESLGADMHTCEDEADQIVAKEVQSRNAEAGYEQYFCYGLDRYIFFSVLH